MRIAGASAVLSLVVLVGCSSSYQSARVLAPGQTQLTGALVLTDPDEELADNSFWTGDLQVRHGFTPKVEGGMRFSTLSGFESLHTLAADVKVELVPDHVSVSLPVGIIVLDDERDLDYGGYFLAPTVLLGTELGPNAELVVAPRLMIVSVDANVDTQTLYGASMGVRLSTDLARWAIHPEVGLITGDNLDGTLLSAGVGLSTTY